jgi:protein-tyrosine-phosphatase
VPRPAEDLPGSVLFACNHNSIRSPIAEAVMKYLHGHKVYVQSVGLRPELIDPFAVAVLDEIGIDKSRHRPRSFEDLEDDYFDLVISLSPEAQHRAVELTRTSSCEIEFWPTMDPSLITGAREQRLDAYRALRDDLLRRIRERFPPGGAPIMA